MARPYWKTILAIAWPLIIANSFWNLQLTIDRIFLGSFATEALGAAMAVMGVFWVPMALLQQTAAYVTTFVAQYYGAGEEKNIGPALWQAFFVAVVGGVLFLGLNLFSPAFFRMVGHGASIEALEVSYFNALSYSALPTAIVAAVSGFFTGLGRTRMVILINFVGLLLNVALDYLLIFGKLGFPALGIAGAGLATALATYGAAAMGCYLLVHNAQAARFALGDWKPRWQLLTQFLKFGIPSGLQWALEGLAFTVFLIFMGRLSQGEAALSSSSIAVTVMMLSVLPTMGVAQAVLTLVGQKLGEKNPAEAQALTWAGVKISSLYMAVVAASFWLIPDFYLAWFKNDANPELWAQVTLLAPQLLKMVALFTVFDSAYLNISFALKGAGDTRFVSLVALVIPWPLMVLPAYLLQTHPNAAVYSWAWVVVYSVTITLVLCARFQQGKWKSMSVIN